MALNEVDIFLIIIIETGSYYTAQASLEIDIVLPQLQSARIIGLCNHNWFK